MLIFIFFNDFTFILLISTTNLYFFYFCRLFLSSTCFSPYFSYQFLFPLNFDKKTIELPWCNNQASSTTTSYTFFYFLYFQFFFFVIVLQIKDSFSFWSSNMMIIICVYVILMHHCMGNEQDPTSIGVIVNRPNQCNIFEGTWEYDDANIPYYDSSTCPFISKEFDCLSNGRPDQFYLHYRWKPHHCDLPRYFLYMFSKFYMQRWSDNISTKLKG